MAVQQRRNTPRVLVEEPMGDQFLHYKRHHAAEAKCKALHAFDKPAHVMERQLARRNWSVLWDSVCVKLVKQSHVADAEAQEQASSISFEGHSLEDLKGAVATASSSLDAHELHEASTVLRDATALVQAEGCPMVMRLNAVPALLRLLSSDDLALQEDAASALLNLLVHEQTRSILVSQGTAVPMVRALCQVALPSTRATIAACLSFLIKNDAQAILLKTSGALEVLVNMLRVAHQEASATIIAPRTPPGVVSFHRSGSKSLRARASADGGVLFSPSVESSADNGVHDACLALMHMSGFACVKRELLKLGVIPLLVEVAKVAPLIDSEHSVAALFHMLSCSDEGAGAICLENKGDGARALFTLAQDGMEVAQVLALEALICVARRKGPYVEQMRKMGFHRALWEAEEFKNPWSESVREKVLMLKHLLRE